MEPRIHLADLRLDALCFSPTAQAQNLDKPLQSIDEISPPSPTPPTAHRLFRLSQSQNKSLRRTRTRRHLASGSHGKRRRLLEGQKYTRGNQPFSYLIDSFRWSPNGHFILAQLLTTTVVDDSGKTEDSFQTFSSMTPARKSASTKATT